MVARSIVVVVVVAVVLGICLQRAFAAPKPDALVPQNRQELVQRFVEFLHEDKELSLAIEKIDWNDDGLAIRNKRATEGLDDEFANEAKKPGFFDRAAKFVSELLQRFLKWINSNDDN